MKKIIIILLFVLSSECFSYSPFWMGAGTLTHNFLTAQSDTSGSKRLIDFAPTVLLGATIPIWSGRFFLSPAIGYAQFFTEDNSTKREIILQYHISERLFGNVQMYYGFSNYITTIGGDGSTVTLNNGNSSSNFYAPSESKTSYTASFDVAPELILSSDLAFRAQFSIMRFLSSEQRRVSHLITMTYFF
jgi:hypothetical protein